MGMSSTTLPDEKMMFVWMDGSPLGLLYLFSGGGAAGFWCIDELFCGDEWPAGYLAIYPIHEARQYLGVREEGHIGVRDRPRARAVNYYVHTIPTLKVTQKGYVRGS